MSEIMATIAKQDAQAEYIRQHEAMKALLMRIAFPRRGTEDESLDIQDAANLIQIAFTQDALAPTLPNPDLGDLADGHCRMWHREARRLAEKHREKTFYN